MTPSVRLLLLADTHLGFDLPVKPRVQRRRRGPDFLANYHRALAVALAGKVDLVVHGGDVFHRPRVPTSLVYQAFEPLARVADTGTPVFVVPGNHERGRIPHPRIASHPGIHVFDRPRSYVIQVGRLRLCLSGFPYVRRGIRERFSMIVESTGWRAVQADIRLLCMHHCFEGATVGPQNFTFRGAPDVVRARDLPSPFAAVLSGHIHRQQVLRSDLSGRPIAAPVLYPGSIERTSIAEKDEVKGTLELQIRPTGRGGVVAAWESCPLPTRSMVVRDVGVGGLDRAGLERAVKQVIDKAPEDAVLRLRLVPTPGSSRVPPLTAARLRALAPKTMNVELRSPALSIDQTLTIDNKNSYPLLGVD